MIWPIVLIAIGLVMLVLRFFEYDLDYLYTRFVQPGYGDLTTAQDFHQMPTDFFEFGVILVVAGAVWLVVDWLW